MKTRILHFVLFFLFLIFRTFLLGTAEGAAMRPAETVWGELETASTTDSWIFYGQAGDRVIIASTKLSGTMTGTYLKLYPPDGSAVETSNLGGIGINHQIQKTGLYTITVESHARFGTGNYDLTMVKVPGPVSCPSDLDGGTIFPAQTLSGTIHSPSDLDAYHFYGQAGDRVLIGSTKTSGTMTGTYLKLYPPDGDAEAGSLGGIGIDHQLKKTGLYTITVESHAHFGTGGYDISLTKIPSTPRAGIYTPVPSDKSSVAACGESLVWDYVPGANGYDVFFGKDVDRPLALIGDDVPFPTVGIPDIEMDEIYYWHVVARAADGNVFGPYWWFRAGRACHLLSVNKVGSGQCLITDSFGKIRCGSNCEASYDVGTAISLTVMPDDNSIFAGWGGDADCGDGSVSINDNTQCVAICNLRSPVVPPPVQGNPKIAVAPKSLNFGKVPAGQASEARYVTIKNTGAADLVVSSITITGTNASEFGQTNDCSMIPKGSSCTIAITFYPMTPFQKKSATMSIVSNDPKKPFVSVKLMGQNPPPKVSASPKSVNFGKVTVGSTSVIKMVTIKNTGISDLIIGGVSISGSHASEFSQTNDCAILPMGNTCTAAVTFTPTSTGARNAVLGIASNDPKKNVLNVKLSGKGIPSANVLSVQNASMAGAAAIQSTHLISTSNLLLGEIDAMSNASKSLRVAPMTRLMNFALNVAKTQSLQWRNPEPSVRTQGSAQELGWCSDGGTVSMKASWIGPDEPEDLSEIVNLNATLTFNSCREDSVLFKGTIKLSVQGSLLNPSSLALSSSSFSYWDTEFGDSVTLKNLKIVVSDVVLTAEKIVRGTITVDGSVYGFVDSDPINEAFDDFRLVYRSVSGGGTVSISGRIKPSCIGAWISVSTNAPLYFSDYGYCPTAGDIAISSTSDTVRMVVSSDYQITIYLNDLPVQSFHDCEDIDGLCG